MKDMKLKHKQKNNILMVILFISLLGLLGVFIYARNWENVNRYCRQWRLEQQAKLEQRRQEKILESVIEVTGIVEMSHDMPVLTRTAEGVDILEVPLISQTDCGYLTGCELVSGAMMMNYYEQDITAQDLYEVIPKSDNPIDENGIGISPNQYFIGNPQYANGYGCYAEPLLQAMNQLLSEGWHAVNISGTDLESIESNYLKQKTPVIIWATFRMTEPEMGKRWMLEDGTDFQWLAGEHCLVLVGSDENYYYFNDPDHPGEVIGYERDLVELRYEQLGRQAIIISR